jgi:glutamate--cysteine ligase
MITYLQVGLLYDEESLQSILDMTFDWTKEEREMLRRKVICTLYTSVIRNIVV